MNIGCVLACYHLLPKAHPRFLQSDSLDGANWVRFRCYATRVRYLHHADGDKATKQLPNLDEQYVTRLSCVKPQDYGPLLPRLQCLHWSVTNDDHGFGAMLEFLSPSIQELLLRSSSSDRNPEAFVNILSRLTERTDIRLTHLTITKRRHHPNIDIAIASYLESRSEITNLKLGVIEAGGRIAIELGKLSHLQSLYLLPSYSDHEQLENFCSTLAESCKLLHTLSLLFLKGVGDGVLPFHPLRPLLRLRGLVHIALVHRVQLKIEESDIAAMGEAWPLARSLDLARLAKEASRIPARLLATFAKSFNPALTHLYVILDFGGVLTTPPSSIIRFQSLHLLDVGVSTVLKNQVGPAANLLASICPAGTYITFDKEKLGKDDRRVWREVKRAVRNAAASPIVVE